MKNLNISTDDHNNIKMVMHHLKCGETEAISLLMEIGMTSMINYPTGYKRIDDFLSQPKYAELIKAMKDVWMQ